MQSITSAGSVAAFLAAVAETVGHDKELSVTATWARSHPGAVATMADLHVRVPSDHPLADDAEYNLSDYAEAGGRVERADVIRVRAAAGARARERRDLIRNLDALTHAQRRIKDASDRLDGYYELRAGLIPAGSVAADFVDRWDGLRAQHRALAGELDERLAEVQQAIIVWAIDAARGVGWLDGHALDPASRDAWVAVALHRRPVPILRGMASRVEGQTTGEFIVCYVALGFTTEALNGKEIHTPTMTALFEVHDHSPYSPLPTEYTMSKLIEYRGEGV